VPIVLKSGSLNLLEPSGPVKVCNGIALPYHRSKITGVTFQYSVIFTRQLVQKFKSGHSDNTGSTYIAVHQKAKVQNALAYSRILVKILITEKARLYIK
jgi:hypothetical protein